MRKTELGWTEEEIQEQGRLCMKVARQSKYNKPRRVWYKMKAEKNTGAGLPRAL